MDEPIKAGAGYFSNRDCPHYLCHKGAEAKDFNCLFCFCPLYPLGADCGGDFRLLPKGGKDCSACLYPHRAENYRGIVAKLSELCRRFPPPQD